MNPGEEFDRRENKIEQTVARKCRKCGGLMSLGQQFCECGGDGKPVWEGIQGTEDRVTDLREPEKL